MAQIEETGAEKTSSRKLLLESNGRTCSALMQPGKCECDNKDDDNLGECEVINTSYQMAVIIHNCATNQWVVVK